MIEIVVCVCTIKSLKQCVSTMTVKIIIIVVIYNEMTTTTTTNGNGRLIFYLSVFVTPKKNVNKHYQHTHRESGHICFNFSELFIIIIIIIHLTFCHYIIGVGIVVVFVVVEIAIEKEMSNVYWPRFPYVCNLHIFFIALTSHQKL